MTVTPLLPFLVLLVACAPTPAPNPGPSGASARGTLRGTISVGPTCPAESAASDCAPAPAPGARLVVRALRGDEHARVTADANGRYSVDLPPGRYVVELDPRGVEFTKSLPAEVAIVAGGETRLDVAIDSGIR